MTLDIMPRVNQYHRFITKCICFQQKGKEIKIEAFSQFENAATEGPTWELPRTPFTPSPFAFVMSVWKMWRNISQLETVQRQQELVRIFISACNYSNVQCLKTNKMGTCNTLRLFLHSFNIFLMRIM